MLMERWCLKTDAPYIRRSSLIWTKMVSFGIGLPTMQRPNPSWLECACATALATVLVAAVVLWEWITGDSDDYDWR